jgi:hypothetical protein
MRRGRQRRDRHTSPQESAEASALASSHVPLQKVCLTPRLSCGARTQPRFRHRPPARRQLQPVVRWPKLSSFLRSLAKPAVARSDCPAPSTRSRPRRRDLVRRFEDAHSNAAHDHTCPRSNPAVETPRTDAASDDQLTDGPTSELRLTPIPTFTAFQKSRSQERSRRSPKSTPRSFIGELTRAT